MSRTVLHQPRPLAERGDQLRAARSAFLTASVKDVDEVHARAAERGGSADGATSGSVSACSNWDGVAEIRARVSAEFEMPAIS
jgi:hypothetical protein